MLAGRLVGRPGARGFSWLGGNARVAFGDGLLAERLAKVLRQIGVEHQNRAGLGVEWDSHRIDAPADVNRKGGWGRRGQGGRKGSPRREASAVTQEHGGVVERCGFQVTAKTELRRRQAGFDIDLLAGEVEHLDFVRAKSGPMGEHVEAGGTDHEAGEAGEELSEDLARGGGRGVEVAAGEVEGEQEGEDGGGH